MPHLKPSRSRSRGQLLCPDDDGDELDHREEGSGSLLVSCCDAAEVFELVEEALDEVTLFVEIGVVGGNAGAGPIEWNDRLSVGMGDGAAEVIGVIGLVGKDMLGGQTIDQRLGLGDIVALPGR